MKSSTALRSRRLALGLSQAQVAERAGFKQQHYSQLERGVRPLTTRMMERLAPALQCHPADLLQIESLRARDTREEELLTLFHELRSETRDALLLVARTLVEAEPPRPYIRRREQQTDGEHLGA